MDGEVQGLKAVPPTERPYVPIAFWAFRLMVAIGLVLTAIALFSTFLRWRGWLYYDTGWFSMLCAFRHRSDRELGASPHAPGS